MMKEQSVVVQVLFKVFIEGHQRHGRTFQRGMEKLLKITFGSARKGNVPLFMTSENKWKTVWEGRIMRQNGNLSSPIWVYMNHME